MKVERAGGVALRRFMWQTRPRPPAANPNSSASNAMASWTCAEVGTSLGDTLKCRMAWGRRQARASATMSCSAAPTRDQVDALVPLAPQHMVRRPLAPLDAGRRELLISPAPCWAEQALQVGTQALDRLACPPHRPSNASSSGGLPALRRALAWSMAWFRLAPMPLFRSRRSRATSASASVSMAAGASPSHAAISRPRAQAEVSSCPARRAAARSAGLLGGQHPDGDVRGPPRPARRAGASRTAACRCGGWRRGEGVVEQAVSGRRHGSRRHGAGIAIVSSMPSSMPCFRASGGFHRGRSTLGELFFVQRRTWLALTTGLRHPRYRGWSPRLQATRICPPGTWLGSGQRQARLP